jgi:hypothetical protein
VRKEEASTIFFSLFHWSPYYVMLLMYENTQQMENPDRKENIEKKVLKVDDQENYEKSGFKSMMDNVEETKKQALESVPQRLQMNYWMVTRRIRNKLRSI